MTAQAEWPPTAAQLAGMATALHWRLEEVAYDLPRGDVDRARLDQTADAMEQLARALRLHQAPDPRGVIRGEVAGMGQLWDRDKADQQEQEHERR